MTCKRNYCLLLRMIASATTAANAVAVTADVIQRAIFHVLERAGWDGLAIGTSCCSSLRRSREQARGFLKRVFAKAIERRPRVAAIQE
jgi:hypothetical protein